MNSVTAPVDEPVYSLGDYLAILKRRRGVLLGTALIIILIAVAIAWGLPSVYRSSATILIEQQEIPQELVRSTVTTFADQRLQLIRQRVMTTSNLVEIIDKYGLYQEERDTTPLEQIVSELAGDIEMETVSADVVDPRTGRPAQATIAFTIAYKNRSPDLAQRVANELTSLYLNENLKTRTTMTAETSEFLSGEAAKLESRIGALEAELADFKRTNADSLPELAQLNLQLMDRTERELVDAERELRALNERQIYLTAELAQLLPTIPAPARPSIISGSGERLLEGRDRLLVLRTQYLGLKSKYADDHPDVIRLRRELTALENELGEDGTSSLLQERVDALASDLASARERYSDAHPDVRRLSRELASARTELENARANDTRSRITDVAHGERENPAYVHIKAQREATQSEIRALKTKLVELRGKLEGYETRLAQGPEVERSFRALSRDYDNALAKYQEIKAKQMEAQLAQSLESEQKGERFTLIEPPLLPEEPDSPNRLAIFLLGIVLSTAGGFGTAALSEALDGTVRGRRGMVEIFGAPPLAAIPHISTPGEIGGRYLKRGLLVLAALAVLAGIALVVHLYYLPLDVAWFAALRRLGL